MANIERDKLVDMFAAHILGALVAERVRDSGEDIPEHEVTSMTHRAYVTADLAVSARNNLLKG